ncbi:MAG: hypothetical protein IJV16_01145 [Lachnospiraceae bacterium]|nr:hypothetical protein [Lachnospiraceae bacterium]
MADSKDRKSNKWYRLDNAAKIIPSSAKGADTRVFRICCELKEEVDPDILQEALDDIREEFPMFNCVLKKGFFWYYLEDSDLEPEVTEDRLPACSPIYYPGRVNLLYRVNYFKRRINLEMFHVLADGTGGFIFLKRLVSRYLELSHEFTEEKYEGEISSVQEKGGNAFDRYYSKQDLGSQLKQVGKISVGKAYQITGDIDENLLPHLLEGAVSASRIVALAKENKTTVGIYTTSLYIEAVIDAMSVRDKQRPIVIQVPVNLRQFFSSDTTRNFFGVINIVYYPKQYDGTIESVIKAVKGEYEEQLSEEKIEQTMNTYASWEHNIAVKMVPIWIKDIVIDFFNRRAKKGVTTTLSNLGRIQMPESLEPYVDRFSAFMAAPSQQVCISSFGDKMVFGEVSPYSTHEVMLHFFRRLKKLGVDVELASNDYDTVSNKKANKSGRKRKTGKADIAETGKQDKEIKENKK